MILCGYGTFWSLDLLASIPCVVRTFWNRTFWRRRCGEIRSVIYSSLFSLMMLKICCQVIGYLMEMVLLSFVKIWKPYTGPAAELLRWSTILMKLLSQNMDFYTKLCCNKLVCILFKLVFQCLTEGWFDHSYQKNVKIVQKPTNNEGS